MVIQWDWDFPVIFWHFTRGYGNFNWDSMVTHGDFMGSDGDVNSLRKARTPEAESCSCSYHGERYGEICWILRKKKG